MLSPKSETMTLSPLLLRVLTGIALLLLCVRTAAADSNASRQLLNVESQKARTSTSDSRSVVMDVNIRVVRKQVISGYPKDTEAETMTVHIRRDGHITVSHRPEKNHYGSWSVTANAKEEDLTAEDSKSLLEGDKPLLQVILPAVIRMLPVCKITDL